MIISFLVFLSPRNFSLVLAQKIRRRCTGHGLLLRDHTRDFHGARREDGLGTVVLTLSQSQWIIEALACMEGMQFAADQGVPSASGFRNRFRLICSQTLRAGPTFRSISDSQRYEGV